MVLLSRPYGNSLHPYHTLGRDIFFSTLKYNKC